MNAIAVWLALFAVSLAAGQQDLGRSPLVAALARARPAPWLPIQVARVYGEQLVPPALSALKAQDPVVRARAAFVLGEAGCAEAASALAGGLRDRDRRVRLHAGVALCRLGDPRGLQEAGAALQSARPWLKYYAIVGLWRLGDRRAQELVSAARSDPSPLIAYAATAALRTWDVKNRGLELPANLPSAPPPQGDALSCVVNALVGESDWWWHRGKYWQCVRCNDAAVFLAPDAEDMYTNSAWLLWSMGYHTQAIGTYHRCIANNPGSSHGPFYLGFYYFQHRDLQAAEKYLRLAVRNNPRDHLARRALAHTLEKQGRLAEALEQWRVLARQRPSDGSVRLNIDRLRKKMSQQPRR